MRSLSMTLTMSSCFVALSVSACLRSPCYAGENKDTGSASFVEARDSALNRLRNEVNKNYGYQNGAPRVNRGPCGRFAQHFYERWNSMFDQEVKIAFLMSGDGSFCDHVLIRFPDGQFFDGGNGIVYGENLVRQFGKIAGDRQIEVMEQFDFELLEKRSYGFNRKYENCPNYSGTLTIELINKHLRELKSRGHRFSHIE